MKRRGPDLRSRPATVGLLCNGFGAGFILPLYYLFQLCNLPKERGIPLRHSESLVAAMIAGSYLPAAAMLWMPLISRSIMRQQDIIALFQVAPLLTTVIQHLVAATHGKIATEGTSVERAQIRILRRSFILIAIIPALCHIYTVVSALRTTGLVSVYIPGPNSQVTAASLDKIAHGAILFLKYDWIMINLSTLAWSFSMVNEIVSIRALSLLGSLLVVNCAVGPGALVCAILWWRENSLVEVTRKQ